MVAVDGRARQERHVVVARELGDDVRDPVHRRPPVDRLVAVQERAAELVALVGHEHAGARPRGGEGRGETRRPRPDDEHVDVAVDVIVAVGVRGGRRAPETGGLSDEALVGLPAGGREHEGLVVEPRRHQRAAEAPDDAHRVAVGARPAVDGVRDEALEQHLLGGANVRHRSRRVVPELQYRVRLLDTGGDDAARARVLEAPPDDVDAVGEQRRGERVAAVPHQASPGEREEQRLAAIDPAARRQAVPLLGAEVVGADHERAPAPVGGVSFDGTLAPTSCHPAPPPPTGVPDGVRDGSSNVAPIG